MRTREIANTPEKGQKRYRLYRSVIKKYNEAMERGFFLEAIALMESIITDRMESALINYGIISKDEAFMMLGKCLDLLDKEGLISDELYAEIDTWRGNRNRALHEMAKIEEGENAVFKQRYDNQKIIAEKGYDLFSKLKTELQ